MDTRQQEGEPERREGLGGRVRRFVDSELSRVLNKEDREADRSRTDYRRDSDPAPDFDRSPEFDRAGQEPVIPSAGEPGRAEPATTTAPVDPEHDPTASERVEEPGPRSSDQAAADGSAERVGLLNDPAALRDQWQRVQGAFVDDPQRAVHEASLLVERTLQEIHENVSRGHTGDPTSTEDLRVSFQRYREFFHRLLSA